MMAKHSSHGVTMMVAGTRHHARAAVALMTLREWFTGDVCLFADEAAMPVVEGLARQADTDIHPFECNAQRRNTGYANKPRLANLTPYDYTLQLDADTAVVGFVDQYAELWPRYPEELVITRYSNWNSLGGIIGSRIKGWAHAFPELVQKQVETAYPAVNTGVLTFGPECTTARRDWYEWTQKNPRTFICDEIAMQLLYPERSHVRMLDDRWNWSPIHGVAPEHEAKIHHYHGAKHLKRRKGIVRWWPMFMRAYEINYGGLADWCPAGDKHLTVLIDANGGVEGIEPETVFLPWEK